MNRIRFLTLSLLLATSSWCSAAAQDRDPAAERSSVAERLVKYRTYLDRNPFHETVFQRLLHEAVEASTLESVRDDYAQRVAEDPSDFAARVVLARMHAHTGRSTEALALLDPVELPEDEAEPLGDDTAPFLFLRATLRLAASLRSDALADFDRAAEVCTDPVLATEILTRAGEAWMRVPNYEQATARFRRLAERDPESFSQRMLAAELLLRHGLEDAALAELETAFELARGDAAECVRAQVAIGRLEERRGRGEEAQHAYRAAAALMGPGHWQREELFERQLALHRGRGTLAELEVQCRQDVENAPGDHDARRFLARTLVTAGEREDALEVLARAALDLPESLELGREYARLLVDADQAELAVAEYQRLAGVHPREAGLHREAGILLATSVGSEAARAQWELELQRAPESVELHLELARLHAHFGLSSGAERLLRRAMRLAPADMRPVRALAEGWRGRGLGSRAGQLLEQVEADALERDDALVLEEVAFEWIHAEEPRRALRAMELCVEVTGDSPGERRRLLTTLAGLCEEHGSFERASHVLFELLSMARDPAEREVAVARLGRHYRANKRLGHMERDWERQRRGERDGLESRLLRVRELALEGEHGDARAELDELHLAGGVREDVLRHSAWLSEKTADYSSAAAALRALIEIVPSERRDLLEEIARLHRRSGDLAALERTYDELVELGTTNISLLAELARDTKRHDPERALELLLRSLELRPDDVEVRLELADVLARTEQTEAARDHLSLVLRGSDAKARARARRMCRKLAAGQPLAVEVESLRKRLREQPERFELGVLLALYAAEQFDYDTAQEACTELLGRFPREPALLELREELRGLSLSALDAPLRPELAWGEVDTAEVELAVWLLGGGERTRARAVLAGLPPIVAANTCLYAGAPNEAQRILRELAEGAPADVHARVRLAVAYRAEERASWALRAIDEAVALSDAPWHLLLLQGELRAQRRHRQGARNVGRQLLRRLDYSRALAATHPLGRRVHERRVDEVVAFYTASGLERDFTNVATGFLLENPADPPLLDAVLSQMSRSHASRARKLIAAAQEAGVPSGWDARAWSALIDEHDLRFARRPSRRSSTEH